MIISMLNSSSSAKIMFMCCWNKHFSGLADNLAIVVGRSNKCRNILLAEFVEKRRALMGGPLEYMTPKTCSMLGF